MKQTIVRRYNLVTNDFNKSMGTQPYKLFSWTCFLCRKSTLINPAISSTALTLRKWHISRGSEECLASIMCAWEYALTHFFNSIDIKNSRSNRLSLLFGHYSRLYIITMVTVSGNWLMETKRLAQTSICPGPAVFT